MSNYKRGNTGTDGDQIPREEQRERCKLNLIDGQLISYFLFNSSACEESSETQQNKVREPKS